MYQDYEAIMEKEEFNMSHAEVGSFLIHQTKILKELEGVVDYHHDYSVLKIRNPELFILVVIVNISDRFSYLLESNSDFEIPYVSKILESFQGLIPLTASEVQSMVITLRSKGYFG